MEVADKPHVPDRLYAIDRAKGLGIALVVWGHLAGQSSGQLPLWFYITVSIVYQFHMPLFMYLSGFVFFYIGAPDRFLHTPANFVWKRFDRLIIPFATFGIIVVIGKYIGAHFGSVDDNVQSIEAGFRKVIENSSDNPSLSIWYLLVLFIYSVVTPLIWIIGRRSFAILLLIAGLGWIFQTTEAYYFHRIATFFIFFVIGGLCASYRSVFIPIMSKLWLPSAVFFVIINWYCLDRPFALLVCGLASIPTIHGLFLQNFWNRDRLLLLLGRYSMSIYLMNTIFIGITKIIWHRAFPIEGWWIGPFLGTLLVVAIVGPIIVRKAILAIPGVRWVGRYLT